MRDPGRYVFRVELQDEDETEWHDVAAIPLEVEFSPPEDAEPEEYGVQREPRHYSRSSCSPGY